MTAICTLKIKAKKANKTKKLFFYNTIIIFFQKVKELTYMHSEGIMAGELKHGPLALVDEAMPVMMIIMRDPVYTKCMNALQQVYYNRNSLNFRW